MRLVPMLFLALSLGLLIPGSASAAPREVSLTPSQGDATAALHFVENTAGGCKVEFALPSLNIEDIQAADQTWQALTIDGGGIAGAVGQPGLPTFQSFIAVPAGQTVTARAVVRGQRTLGEIHLLPVQPSEGEEFALDASAYSGARPAPDAETVSVGEPVVIHGVRLVPFILHPVSYDPLRDEVTVLTDVALDFTFSGGAFGPGDLPRTVGESFDRLFTELVVNWDTLRDEVKVGPGTYLIITQNNSSVTTAIQPLVDWRKRQGYNVLVATTAQAGTTNTAIKSYIQGIYNATEPQLEYVCLVGDVSGTPGLPTFYESQSGYGGEGDHEYTLLAGGDQLSEINIGRLSARNVTELTAIVTKIVNYETNPPVSPDPGWFTRATLTGDTSSSGITVVYCQQWLRAQLEHLGYTDLDTIYQAPFASRMSTSCNLGVTAFAYRGWVGVSGFSTGYIDALNNGGELAFAVIPTCGSGSFASSTHTYSEAFLRNANGGAVGSIGTATLGTHTRYNNCYFSGVWEGVLNTGDRHLGAAHNRGKVELYRNFNSYEPSAVLIWSTWNNLMGDPATEMWQALPRTLTVTYPASLPVGAGALPVEVMAGAMPAVGARVAAVKGTEARVVGYTDAAGRVLLELPPGLTAGSLLLTVTGHDLMPHLGSVTLGSVNSFASVSDWQFDDSTLGDDNGVINPGEGLELMLALTNLGSNLAGGVNVIVSAESEDIEVTQGLASFGDIAGGATVWGGHFVVQMAPDAANNTVAVLRVTAVSGGNSWVSRLELPVVAANIAVDSAVWVPSPGGALPGQSGAYNITLRNNGSRAVSAGTAALTSQSQYVLPSGPAEVAVGAIGIGGTTSVSFTLSISSQTFGGHVAVLPVDVTTAEGSVHHLALTLPVGTVTQNSPTGPDSYGYIALDNLDPLPGAPTYSWIEIDPNYGGAGTTVGLTDNAYEQDDIETLPLPFTFRYYGRNFNSIAICSNGFVTMGPTTLKPFHNLFLPNANSPNTMIAVFWDDLKQSGTNQVYYRYDSAGGRYIVQWSRMRNDDNGQQNCELILYNPAVNPTPTGDGLIVMQYALVTNNDANRAYSTTGIQNLDGSDGITYAYFNVPSAGARAVQAGRAIAFMAMPHVAADGIAVTPSELHLTYPTNFQTVVNLDLTASGPAGTFLSYLASAPAGTFASVTPASGLAPVGQTVPLDVAINTAGLADGQYNVNVTVTSTAGSPVVVPIYLTVGVATPVADQTPRALALSPAYPNPFNPRTELAFALPAPATVRLTIHDLTGRQVAVLVNETRPAGEHRLTWTGIADDGRRLPSGTYLARLTVGGEVKTQKLMLVK